MIASVGSLAPRAFGQIRRPKSRACPPAGLARGDLPAGRQSGRSVASAFFVMPALEIAVLVPRLKSAFGGVVQLHEPTARSTSLRASRHCRPNVSVSFRSMPYRCWSPRIRLCDRSNASGAHRPASGRPARKTRVRAVSRLPRRGSAVEVVQSVQCRSEFLSRPVCGVTWSFFRLRIGFFRSETNVPWCCAEKARRRTARPLRSADRGRWR